MVEVTSPKEFKHLVHVGSDFSWSFDPELQAEMVFRKVKKIGKGGFGSVYQIYHTDSGSILAGKVITEDVMSPGAIEALNREIDLLKEIVTPYTVKYFGSISYEKSLMVLMEYCDRGSLRDMIDYRNETLSENQISLILSDLIEALSILHKKHHILHRDIKAANILLNSRGQTRVTDFGVSRKFEQTNDMQTRSVVGTPYWMAPEVINGDPYSFPADIWSIGATAVELAEGAPPYCELVPTAAMVKIATRGFQGFRTESKFTADFQDFCIRCMTMDENHRPSLDQLKSHPFILRAKNLNRMMILKPLVDTIINFSKLEGEEGDDEIFFTPPEPVELTEPKSESEKLNDDIQRLWKYSNWQIIFILALFMYLVYKLFGYSGLLSAMAIIGGIAYMNKRNL